MKKQDNFKLTIISLMIAVTLVMVMTSLGTISFGIISVTIAHIPILITAIVIGLKEGLIVAFAFGLFSMIRAITAPLGILDPLFANPAISILPRLMIPITTYFLYKYLSKINDTLGTIVAVALGNLTNTFFVYFSMFLFMRARVEEAMGKDFKTVIIGLVSTSTAIKTVLVVIITVPIVKALQKYMANRNA